MHIAYICICHNKILTIRLSSIRQYTYAKTGLILFIVILSCFAYLWSRCCLFYFRSLYLSQEIVLYIFFSQNLFFKEMTKIKHGLTVSPFFPLLVYLQFMSFSFFENVYFINDYDYDAWQHLTDQKQIEEGKGKK